jgi:pimeloyl-ACP methyl ester carboxylesterase
MTGPSQGSTDEPTDNPTDKSIDPTLIRFRPGQRREGGHPVQFCTIHGYRRAFVCVGKGPALLLIHGIGDSSDTWRPVLDQLARHHTIVAPDLLGHGRSEKPRADYSVAAYANGMRDLLSVLEIDRATVIGHSLGGGVAGQFAYQFPERCERLVLVGSGGVGRSVSPFLRLAAVPGIEALMPLFGVPPVRMAGRVAADVLRRFSTALGRDAEELLAVFDALPDTSARRAILRTLRSGVDWRGQVITMLDRAYLAEGLPTLLVWGRHDAVIPLGHGRLAHAAMPGSEFEIFDDAGHFPHHADPERFAELVSDFIRRTKPSPFDQEEWRRRLRRGRPVAEAEPSSETDLELMALALSPLPGAH